MKTKCSYEKIKRVFATNTIKFWKPELIEWIGKENNPVKLAVAACLVNCHDWPKWLPGKPENYSDKVNDGIEFYYLLEVYEMLKQKSENISPIN